MTGTEFATLLESLGLTKTALAAYWKVSRHTVGRLCAAETVEPIYADALRYRAVKERVEEIGAFAAREAKGRSPRTRGK
jgi:hypothetical protein